MTVEIDKNLTMAVFIRNNGCLVQSAGRRRMFLFANFQTENQRHLRIVLNNIFEVVQKYCQVCGLHIIYWSKALNIHNTR